MTITKLFSKFSDLVNDLKSYFVQKSGDTMTGDLFKKAANIDMKQANNGLSSSEWTTAIQNLDKNGYHMSFFGTEANTGGYISTGMWAYNFNTAGQQVGSNCILAGLGKDGTKSYFVTHPPNFRKAIGVRVIATASYTVNSGYFSVLTGLNTGAVVFAQPVYNPVDIYHYTVQPSPEQNVIYVYVRDNSGGYPPNGTTVKVAFLVID